MSSYKVHIISYAQPEILGSLVEVACGDERGTDGGKHERGDGETSVGTRGKWQRNSYGEGGDEGEVPGERGAGGDKRERDDGEASVGVRGKWQRNEYDEGEEGGVQGEERMARSR